VSVPRLPLVADYIVLEIYALKCDNHSHIKQLLKNQDQKSQNGPITEKAQLKYVKNDIKYSIPSTIFAIFLALLSHIF